MQILDISNFYLQLGLLNCEFTLSFYERYFLTHSSISASQLLPGLSITKQEVMHILNASQFVRCGIHKSISPCLGLGDTIPNLSQLACMYKSLLNHLHLTQFTDLISDSIHISIFWGSQLTIFPTMALSSGPLYLQTW